VRVDFVWQMAVHALVLARAGRHAQATELVAWLANRDDLGEPLRLLLAHVYARTAAAAPQRPARGYLRASLEQLRRLDADGWFAESSNADEVRGDLDLEALRGSTAYRRLLGRRVACSPSILHSAP
jgi:hypothetical protein